MSKYVRSPWSLQHYFIQDRLIAAIEDPTFKFELPKLMQATWDSVLQPTRFDDDERERLEFLGDAILHICVALELYKLFPLGTPHLYTVLRVALTTNCTFVQFMKKAGVVHKRYRSYYRSRDKVAADAFETLIAAYYFERGLQAVCDWVSSTLGPLIRAARKAYGDFLEGLSPHRLGKRSREELDDYQAEKKRARYAAHAPSNHSFKERRALDRYVDVREKQGILSILECAGFSQAEVTISSPKVVSATASSRTSCDTRPIIEENPVHVHGSRTVDNVSSGSNRQIEVVQPNSLDAEDGWIDADDGIQMGSASHSSIRPLDGHTSIRRVYSPKLTGSRRSKSVQRYSPRISSSTTPRTRPSTTLPSALSKLNYYPDHESRFPDVSGMHLTACTKHSQVLPADTSKVVDNSQASKLDKDHFDSVGQTMAPAFSKATTAEKSTVQSSTESHSSKPVPCHSIVDGLQNVSLGNPPKLHEDPDRHLTHHGRSSSKWTVANWSPVSAAELAKRRTSTHNSGESKSAPGSSENPIIVEDDNMVPTDG